MTFPGIEAVRGLDLLKDRAPCYTPCYTRDCWQTPSAFTAALQSAGLCGRVSLSVFQYDFPNTREPQALSGSVSSPLLVTLVQQRNGAASVCPQLMSLSLRMSLMGCTSHSCACACARGGATGDKVAAQLA